MNEGQTGPMKAARLPRKFGGDSPSRESAESGAGRWPADQPLPGAVNVAFFDGHGELVKLARLWQLYWHVDLAAARQVARLAVRGQGLVH